MFLEDFTCESIPCAPAAAFVGKLQAQGSYNAWAVRNRNWAFTQLVKVSHTGVVKPEDRVVKIDS